MYNLNIPNINEVGHYKKINVTELRQMQDEELIRFFVDMPGGEFVRQKKKMTQEELEEIEEFINSIPDDVFDEIERQKQQQIESECLRLIQQFNKIDNIIDQEVKSTTNFINSK